MHLIRNYGGSSSSSSHGEKKSCTFRNIRLRRLVEKYIIDHKCRAEQPVYGILLGDTLENELLIKESFPLVVPKTFTDDAPFVLKNEIIRSYINLNEEVERLQIVGWYRAGTENKAKDEAMYSQILSLYVYAPVLVLIDDANKITLYQNQRFGNGMIELGKVQWEYVDILSEPEHLIQLYLCDEHTRFNWRLDESWESVFNNTYRRPFAEPVVPYECDENLKTSFVNIDWPHARLEKSTPLPAILPPGDICLINAARELTKNKNLREAFNLIQRLLKTYPRHPDVLREYGSIAEANRDMLLAEKMYLKAIQWNPDAESGDRENVLADVDYHDNKCLYEIYNLLKHFELIPRSTPLVKAAIHRSFFDHVWNSIAIEGSPVSREDAELILRGCNPTTPTSPKDANEVIGMKDAFVNYLPGSFVVTEVSVEKLYHVHRLIMEPVDDTIAGLPRSILRNDVNFGNYSAVGYQNVEKEMEKLVEFLKHSSNDINIIELAALAHFFLIGIHPHKDGNGRTARFVMGALLADAGLPFVVIPFEEKQEYLETSIDAHEGHRRSFVRFVYKQLRKNLETFINEFNNSQTPMVE